MLYVLFLYHSHQTAKLYRVYNLTSNFNLMLVKDLSCNSILHQIEQKNRYQTLKTDVQI